MARVSCSKDSQRLASSDHEAQQMTGCKVSPCQLARAYELRGHQADSLHTSGNFLLEAPESRIEGRNLLRLVDGLRAPPSSDPAPVNRADRL